MFPAGTWRKNDVVLTSMRHDYVASMSIRRHFGTKCPLGSHSPKYRWMYFNQHIKKINRNTKHKRFVLHDQFVTLNIRGSIFINACFSLLTRLKNMHSAYNSQYLKMSQSRIIDSKKQAYILISVVICNNYIRQLWYFLLIKLFLIPTV